MSERIRLDGCLNFRDLGGYPTRAGRRVRTRQLFRSDALHLLSVRDISHLRDALRIGDIIDLRSSAELESEGRGALAREAIRFHHVPLFDGQVQGSRELPGDSSLADRYFLLAEFAKQPIARVIEIIASTDAPAVYHCAAGKDRTGVLSAILLALLEVADEVIVADYALSQENLDQIIDRLMGAEGYRTMLAALPPETLHALPETMSGFLERLHTAYDTVADYARSAGLSDTTLDRLRERLLA